MTVTKSSAAQMAKETAALFVAVLGAALATQKLVAAAIPTIQSVMATPSALGAIMPWYISPMMSFTKIGVTGLALFVAVLGAALVTQKLVAAAIPTIQSVMATPSALGAIMPWYISPMMSFTKIGVTGLALPVAVLGASVYGVKCYTTSTN